VLIISNQPRALRLSNFEITCTITPCAPLGPLTITNYNIDNSHCTCSNQFKRLTDLVSGDCFERNLTAILQAIPIFLIMIFKNDY